MALASIPIIIHLLNRRRFRIREWAAMKFLLESVRKNRRRIRIEEIILLALRTLVLVLLATAIARFTGCGETAGGSTTKGSSAVVYILDDSPSMGQRLGSGSLFSAAATELAETVRDPKRTPDGDRLAILLTSDPPASGEDKKIEAFLDLKLVEKNIKETTVRRIQALTPSGKRGKLIDAMTTAERILQDKTLTNKRVVIISDFRKFDFGRDQVEAIRKKFRDLRDAGVKVTAMDYGRDGKANLTVESIEMTDKFAVAKQPVHLRLTVRNNGVARAENVSVGLKIRYPFAQADRNELDGIDLPAQSLKAVEPQDTASMEIQVSPPQAGPAVVSATLGGDDLLGDNTAGIAMDVRDAIHVLVIDGNYDLTNPLADESYFFTFAVDPNRNGSYGCKPEVVSPDNFGTAQLDDYDLIVMMNLPLFPSATDKGAVTYPQLEALEKYVAGGGGLAIFTGDKISTEFYGPTDPDRGLGRFYNHGAGLLPMPVGAQVGDPSNLDNFFRIDPKTIAAESLLTTFSKLRNEGVDPTGLIRVFAFNQAMEGATLAATRSFKPARVLARFNDPKTSPAIVAREYGKGTVVLFCTTASLRWNDWCIDEVGTYAATMNDMLTYLARPLRAELTGLVGEPILYDVPPRLKEAKATLRCVPLFPSAEDIALAGVDPDRPSLLKYDRAVIAGTYWLRLEMPDKSVRNVLYSQNVDPAEGRLEPGHRPEITAAFGGNEKDYTYVDRTGGPQSDVAASLSDKEYWMYLIAAMLVLMAAETFLGQRFGHYAT